MNEQKSVTTDSNLPVGPDSAPPEASLTEYRVRAEYKKYGRFALAALGSIPWVGGVISAMAALSAERDQERINDLQRAWLQEHTGKVQELGDTLADIFKRLDSFGDEIQERIESPSYLALVREAFRSWDQADTDEKKRMLKNLITNAGGTKLCGDDLVRLFIHWIEQYHETHFTVIKEIYHNPQITRANIWDKIHGPRPREDSADADLFKYLIRDLSMGGVIRQERETDYEGRFLRKVPQSSTRGNPGRLMESAFEDTKPYVLTELGKQFVHYVMNESVSRIPEESDTARPGVSTDT